MRGDRKKQEERGKGKGEDEAIEDGKIVDIKGYRPKPIPQLMWRECIKKAESRASLTLERISRKSKNMSKKYQVEHKVR